MSRSLSMPDTGPAPRDGDVLVIACSDRAPLIYALQPWGGSPQIKFPSRDAAEKAAGRFARAERVNVWLVEDGGLHLLEECRPKPRRRRA